MKEIISEELVQHCELRQLADALWKRREQVAGEAPIESNEEARLKCQTKKGVVRCGKGEDNEEDFEKKKEKGRTVT